MTQIAITASHPRTCVGCLGSGSCWVCLGAGRLPDDARERRGCARCGSTGLCAESATTTMLGEG